MQQRSTTRYDSIGNVIETVDFNGDQITYDYDSTNRLTAKRLVNAGLMTQYTYTMAGRRESVTDARGTTRYSYNEWGQLSQEITPDGKTLNYTYDKVTGKVARVATASGTTNYQYNGLGQLQTVTATYDQVGNKQTVTELNGRRVEYTYDELDRLTAETMTDPVNGSRRIEYTYDNVGNRLSRNDSVAGLTTYVYDGNDRLLTETSGGMAKTYTYDNNGNLVQVQGPDELMTYTWEAALIQVLIKHSLAILIYLILPIQGLANSFKSETLDINTL